MTKISFDVEHENRKDWRKPYYDSRAVDGTCRNHGDCPHCEGRRIHKNQKRAAPVLDIEFKTICKGWASKRARS